MSDFTYNMGSLGVTMYASKLELRITANTPEELEEYTDIFTKLISELNGGATQVRGTGFWTNKEKELYKEPVNILLVDCFNAASLFVDILPALRAYMDLGKQEALYVGIDGKAFIFSREQVEAFYSLSTLDKTNQD